jgi:uncharacterized RDD family membrane protein YckC
MLIDGFIVLTAVSLAAAALEALGSPRLLLAAAGSLSFPAYCAFCLWRWGRTAGKWAAGIAVERSDGTPLGPGRALIRTLSYLLSSACLFGGWVLAAFTPGKRALHDYIAGTRVVDVGDAPPWRKRLAAALGALCASVLVLVIAFSKRPPDGPENGAFLEHGVIQNLNALRLGLRGYAEKAARTGANPVPKTLARLVPGELTALPPLFVGGHPETDEIEPYGPEACRLSGEAAQLNPRALKDTGRWGYASGGTGACAAHVFIDCTHQDRNGVDWFRY